MEQFHELIGQMESPRVVEMEDEEGGELDQAMIVE